MDVSVVVPVHGNATTVAALRDRLDAALSPRVAAWELCFVDDASGDDSLDVLRRLASEDARVVAIALARNVGQNCAVLAGLAQTRGARVVVMDADLQDPPEAVPELLSALREPWHAVFAGRRGRYAGVLRTVSSRAFKRLLHLLSGRRLPADAGLFLAMSRTMAERVLERAARGSYVPALVARSGLPATSIPVDRAPRGEGGSAYTESMRWRTAAHALATLLGRGRGADVREIPIRERFGASCPGVRAPRTHGQPAPRTERVPISSSDLRSDRP